MKHISILVLKDVTMASVDGTFQLLTRINDFLKYQGKQPYYIIDLVGLEKHTAITQGMYTIHPNKLLDDVTKTDVVIVPILCGDFAKIAVANKDFNYWVAKQYRAGAEIVSLCAGSFYLASTGLLDGKKCATHWAAANDFSKLYPAVKMITDKIITDEQGIYTSGGSYSYLNLLLYVIEKHLGRDMAVLAAKMFQIDIARKDQTQFAIFVGQKQHGDEAVVNVQEYIEANYKEKLTVDQLSVKNGIARRTFERRFKKSTGNSAIEYIQRVRVEAAKRQLEAGKKTINEVIYDVGYSDVNAFRIVFRKYTGLSLIDYRNKYKP